MPYASEKQRRFVHAKASEGKDWARRFVQHSKRSKLAARAFRRKK